MIKIVCCLCFKDMGQKEGGEGVSHGFCPACYDSYVAEAIADDPEKKARARALVYLRRLTGETRQNGLKIRYAE